MTRGVYKRTEEHKRKMREAQKGKSRAPHKKECQCFCCKAIRGERSGEKHPMFGKTTLDVHKPECSCFFCAATKGELKGEKNPIFGKIDEKHHSWKGDDAKSPAMHQWVRRQKGKAKEYKCVDCGKQAHHWSNVDHSYKRILDHYEARCGKCHKSYDKENNTIEKN